MCKILFCHVLSFELVMKRMQDTEIDGKVSSRATLAFVMHVLLWLLFIFGKLADPFLLLALTKRIAHHATLQIFHII